ncbi:MAG: isopentenyl-diphosphate Delta-isomerase [Flavobacteriaceae bacterium]|jgi:isopentenyl-diphosphate delta-isomerase
MKEEKVLLVDTQDRVLGTMPKLEAHQKGVLHRAFSVFILNRQNALMLQQRAWDKYHSPGLWTNTCCSHQREGEDSLAAGKRRLQEEMGLEAPLTPLFTFIYKAPFDNGLTEHELDHVLLGYSEQSPNPNPQEVADWQWMPLEEVQRKLTEQPEQFTVWFKIIFERFYAHIKQHPCE